MIMRYSYFAISAIRIAHFCVHDRKMITVEINTVVTEINSEISHKSTNKLQVFLQSKEKDHKF